MKAKTLYIVLITTVLSLGWQQPEPPDKQQKDSLTYLCIINGKRKMVNTLDVSKITDPSKIVSISMISDSTGKKKYGKAGKNGVLIIKTQEK
jgi:hypothetical protein